MPNYSQKDIRKSNFPEVTSSQASDYFDLVRSGQNLKISQANLINDFGATGSLEAKGEITGYPVLDTIGTINYIRNIIGGSGIGVSLSPQDGIQLDHNFTVSKAGAAVMYNESSSSPTFRSLQPGAGINISEAGDIIQISQGIPVSSKTVLVYAESDFPTPAAGTITLLGDTNYQLQNDVTTANRFIMSQNTVLTGADANLCNLIYTGVGTMISATDVDFKLADIALTASNGTMFDCSSSGGSNTNRNFNCFFTADEIGTYDNFSITQFETCGFVATTDGISFANNFNVIRFSIISFQMIGGAGNAIDLGTATATTFAIENALFVISTTGVVLTGATSSANINANGLGTVTRAYQIGTSSILNNISQYDALWEMFQNNFIPDSKTLALATHGGATLTIGGIATPVIIGATWTTEFDHRFTTTVGGRFTYVGKGDELSLSASITADIALGIDNVSFFVYINGVQQTNSRVTREFDAGNPGNISLLWAMALDTNDYVEIWVQNDDAAVNVIIVSATLRID